MERGNVAADEGRRLETLFRAERDRGMRLALAVRAVALAVIAVWVVERLGLANATHYLQLLALLAVLGLLQPVLARRDGWPARLGLAALVIAEMGVLVVTLIVPPPGTDPAWPVAMQLRLGSFDYLYVFLAFSVLTYAPGLALLTGAAAVVAWSLGVLWVLRQPGSFTVTDLGRLQGLAVDELVALLTDPRYVSVVLWAQDVILALIITGILAFAVGRARRLVVAQSRVAVERANLARYVSPSLVEELAAGGERLDTVRAHDATVLFLDIRGFTAFAEGREPAEVIAFLRAFHARMAAIVFAHGGTLNKYLGDGVMASFGVPRPDPGAAAAALACCTAMIEAAARWSDERRSTGEPPVQISIGLHHGPVVVGDIGDARCLEFAVLGDAVNVASRLEGLTRELEVTAVIGAAVVAAAGPLSAALAGRLRPIVPQMVRGRARPVDCVVLDP